MRCLASDAERFTDHRPRRATRSGLHPVLNGVKYQEMKKPPLVDVADEWYTRIVCYAFSIPPQPFIKEMNRATAETAKSAAEQIARLQAQIAVIENQQGVGA